MKITVTFDGDDAKDEALESLNGYKYKLALWDLSQYLRGRLKYEEGLSDDSYEKIEQVKEKLYEILSDYNLTLD